MGYKPLRRAPYLFLATFISRSRMRDMRLGSLYRLVAARFSDEGEVLYRGPEADDG